LRSQARLEETLQPRYEPAAPSENPTVPYYTGLILLSVLTFLFLLFLLFKKQIKEVRFATFATVLIGVGLPILAIVQLTTDLVLRGEDPPKPTASPQEGDRQSQQPTEDREASDANDPRDPTDHSDPNNPNNPTDPTDPNNPTDPTDPKVIDASDQTAEPETAVVEVPLDFPNPAPGSTAETAGDNAPATTNRLTLVGSSATPSPSSSPRTTPESPPANRSPSFPATPSPQIPARSPFAPLTQFSQGLQRSAPRRRPSPSFSLSHLDFSQPIRFERLLRSQLQGLDVLALQKLLQDLDFYSGPLDGYLGRETERAIARFQATYALRPDGIFGLSTCEILNAQTPELTLICHMVALGD